MLRKLYDKTLALASHPKAERWLAGVSFAEASFFPIPPDVMMLPMILADRNRAWRIALITTLASLAGAFAGYAIGYFFYESIGKPVMAAYGHLDKFESFQHLYNEWGFWIVFAAGFTPIPFKVVTVASGVTALALLPFGLAALAGRAARFFLVAALLYFFGPPIRRFIERYLGLLTIAFCLLLVGGFVALRYVF
ncbi:MAG: YqaA family protein [Rhodospirillales bacterium]